MPTRQVRVRVLQPLINKGKPGDPCGCPVYHALRPHIRGRFSVALATLVFTGDNGEQTLVALDSKITAFLARFDIGESGIAPMDVIVDIPIHLLVKPTQPKRTKTPKCLTSTPTTS